MSVHGGRPAEGLHGEYYPLATTMSQPVAPPPQGSNWKGSVGLAWLPDFSE